VLLDIDPQLGLARVHRRAGVDGADRLEREALQFHIRVRGAFRELAESDPGRYLVLDATEPIEVVAGRIAASVGRLLALSASPVTRPDQTVSSGQ
jgi:dTMP kinase